MRSRTEAPVSTESTAREIGPFRQRFRLGLLALTLGDSASDHNLRFSLVASATAVLICRLTCAVAWARKGPAIRLALLSQMLMNGFFFSHGFDMKLLALGEPEDLPVALVRLRASASVL